MIVIASKVAHVETLLLEAFTQYAQEPVFCLPTDPRAKDAQVAACWFPDVDYLHSLPNLKLVHSIAAGVEHLNIPALGNRYQYCRVVDDQHKQGMFEYLLWAILYFQRNFDRAISHQAQHQWQQYGQLKAADFNVSVLGLGEMGAYVASKIAQLGYSVSGWSTSSKSIPGVSSYTGQAGLDQLLAKSNLLINLLPLTPQTQGILSRELFLKLPQGAAIVNGGRGQHLNEDDLKAQLRKGHLRGAILDVFSREPLSSDDALWDEPGVLITPHTASHAPLSSVIKQIVLNYKNILNNQTLVNLIDRDKGY